MRDLEHLATTFLHLLTEDPAPVLVGVADVGADDFALAIKDCPRGGVFEQLLCFVAPDDWELIGIASPGRALELDRPERSIEAVNIVHLTARSGHHVSAIQIDDREPRIITGAKGGPAGRVVDACRRALGLTTPPPSVDVHHLWGAMWLDRLAVRLLDERQEMLWGDVAMLHPAVSMLRIPPPEPDELIALAENTSGEGAWSALRAACASGLWHVESIDPALADWMDDGMFARWILEPFGPTLGLVDELCDRLAVPVARAVRRVVDAWALDG